MAPVLVCERLVVEFDGFTVLDGLDFTLEAGELRFLIGPNGAGKTTLLDVIGGQTHPRAGRVLFRGQALTRRPEHAIARLGVGRKFQTPAVFPSLTVWENVAVAALGRAAGGGWRGDRALTARVARALERVGLAERSGVRAGRLAHGEKQWLEIAMVLVQDPAVVLFDEPVAGMTHEERERTGALLTALAGAHTVLVVEHDMEFVRQYARRVTVLHQGRVLCEGPLAVVQSDPRVREVYLGRDHREGD